MDTEIVKEVARKIEALDALAKLFKNLWYEQIRNDVCYHDLNVTVICMGGGFSYGQLGMSHHATEDLSIMRALPNMFVVAPSSTLEVKGAMQSLYKRTGPSYLRLDKSKSDLNDNTISYKLGEACMVRDGSAGTLICCGGILQDVYQATSELKLEGIECRVLSMHTIKPIDADKINESAKKFKMITFPLRSLILYFFPSTEFNSKSGAINMSFVNSSIFFFCSSVISDFLSDVSSA